jgi:predicted acylesterase/phospholipase RssA
MNQISSIDPAPSAVGQSKTALVLAGGGLTGAVYEIGALRAIDELLVNRTVQDFDIIVGTSAGALIGAMLAKGLTPGEMMQMLDGSHPELNKIRPDHLFSFNTGEFKRRSLRLPRTIKAAISHYLRNRSDMNIFDVLWSLLEVLPSGLYDNASLVHFVRQNLVERGLSDDFDTVCSELYIIATDLDTGDRVVFGREPWRDTPLSAAIAASSAVPLLYRPVRLGANELVDGGLRGTASLDLAVEAGAKLIVCINPLVPIDNSHREGVPLLGPDGRYISDKGFQAVGSQILRIVMQSGLDYHVKQLRRRHPDVDIIVIEPRRDDYKMFFYNIMRYSARVTIAQHGFESVTLGLADRYPELKATLARHGLEITRRFVIEDLAAIQQSGNDLEVVRDLIEQGDHRRQPRRGATNTTKSLQQTLADLDGAIAALERRSHLSRTTAEPILE